MYRGSLGGRQAPREPSCCRGALAMLEMPAQCRPVLGGGDQRQGLCLWPCFEEMPRGSTCQPVATLGRAGSSGELLVAGSGSGRCWTPRSRAGLSTDHQPEAERAPHPSPGLVGLGLLLSRVSPGPQSGLEEQAGGGLG